MSVYVELDKQEFIMMVGIPGSGKSYYAENLAKQYDYKLISSDDMREELYGNRQDQTHNAELFIEVEKRVRKYIEEGYNVILDATNLTAKRRKNFLKHHYLKKVTKNCMLVLSPIELCIVRDAGRKLPVGANVIIRMLHNFNFPDESEGWNGIHIIRNYSATEAFDIFTYFNEECDIEQDSLHHTLSLQEHMFKTYSNLKQYIKKDFDTDTVGALMLATKFHDIGKVYAKTFTKKNGTDDGYAHYYEHENIGTYLFATSNATFGLKKNVADLACFLIQHHMDMYNYKGFGFDDLTNKYNKDLAEMISIVYWCDVGGK